MALRKPQIGGQGAVVKETTVSLQPCPAGARWQGFAQHTRTDTSGAFPSRHSLTGSQLGVTRGLTGPEAVGLGQPGDRVAVNRALQAPAPASLCQFLRTQTSGTSVPGRLPSSSASPAAAAATASCPRRVGGRGLLACGAIPASKVCCVCCRGAGWRAWRLCSSRQGMYILAGCVSYVGCRYARIICTHARQSRKQLGTHFTNA